MLLPDEAKAAYQLLADRKAQGKVIIRLRPEPKL